jgi:hypothetical protein
MIKLKIFGNKVLSLKTLSNSLVKINNSQFSSAKGEEEVVFETREDKELRFEDECYYFEREWKKFAEAKAEKRQDHFTIDLSEYQQKEVDILVNKASHLGMIEQQYFNFLLNKSFNKISGVEVGKLNIFRQSFVPEWKTDLPTSNPNHKPTQDIMATLTPFLASGYFAGGAAVAAAEVKVAPKEAVIEKEPEKLVRNFLKYFLESESRPEIGVIRCCEENSPY